jgi:hypothetical protein
MYSRRVLQLQVNASQGAGRIKQKANLHGRVLYNEKWSRRPPLQHPARKCGAAMSTERHSVDNVAQFHPA